MKRITIIQQIPDQSILLNGWENYDYADCFSVKLNQKESVDSVLTRFFSKANGGIVYVSDENNSIRKIRPGKVLDELSTVFYPVGSKAVLFQVIDRNENEIVLGENYSFLDFRTSIWVEQKENVTIMFSSTVVRYNKKIGQLYFFFVKPFHRLLIKFFLGNLVLNKS